MHTMKHLAVGVIGPGLVGSELLSQLATVPTSATGQLGIKVVALCNSKQMMLFDGVKISESNSSASYWKQKLKNDGAALDFDEFTEHIKRTPDVPVIVDCTSSDSVAQMYPKWLSNSVNVVTPNKRAFSSQLGLFREILDIQRKQRVYCFHEATVGAGLPIISTLRDLIDTGDEVVKIEGILSGTMSFIFNQFSSKSGLDGSSFSKIITEAKLAGFTEPDPREDLNGVDVARKAVILGRTCGANLDLSTLKVENIVPEPLRQLPNVEEFLKELAKFDNSFDKLNKEAKSENKLLRYVFVVEPKSGNAEVCLKMFHDAHPFASIQGADNIIAFTTRRYNVSPLIVQGAGAGAAVTAAGVFSDLLKLSRLFG